jgi:hypothetical protein
MYRVYDLASSTSIPASRAPRRPPDRRLPGDDPQRAQRAVDALEHTIKKVGE